MPSRPLRAIPESSASWRAMAISGSAPVFSVPPGPRVSWTPWPISDLSAFSGASRHPWATGHLRACLLGRSAPSPVVCCLTCCGHFRTCGFASTWTPRLRGILESGVPGVTRVTRQRSFSGAPAVSGAQLLRRLPPPISLSPVSRSSTSAQSPARLSASVAIPVAGCWCRPETFWGLRLGQCGVVCHVCPVACGRCCYLGIRSGDVRIESGKRACELQN